MSLFGIQQERIAGMVAMLTGVAAYHGKMPLLGDKNGGR